MISVQLSDPSDSSMGRFSKSPTKGPKSPTKSPKRPIFLDRSNGRGGSAQAVYLSGRSPGYRRVTRRNSSSVNPWPVFRRDCSSAPARNTALSRRLSSRRCSAVSDDGRDELLMASIVAAGRAERFAPPLPCRRCPRPGGRRRPRACLDRAAAEVGMIDLGNKGKSDLVVYRGLRASHASPGFAFSVTDGEGR